MANSSVVALESANGRPAGSNVGGVQVRRLLQGLVQREEHEVRPVCRELVVGEQVGVVDRADFVTGHVNVRDGNGRRLGLGRLELGIELVSELGLEGQRRRHDELNLALVSGKEQNKTERKTPPDKTEATALVQM